MLDFQKLPNRRRISAPVTGHVAPAAARGALGTAGAVGKRGCACCDDREKVQTPAGRPSLDIRTRTRATVCPATESPDRREEGPRGPQHRAPCIRPPHLSVAERVVAEKNAGPWPHVARPASGVSASLGRVASTTTAARQPGLVVRARRPW